MTVRLQTELGLRIDGGEDGAGGRVSLLTDVQRPATGRSPAVLLRTPYGTGSIAMLKLARWLARQGWAAVFQNVRGRYGSSGRFEPFVHERADGDATLEWLLEQPWCDGRVMLLGISYSTYTAAAMATSELDSAPSSGRTPEWLGFVSLVPMVRPRDHFYEGGAFRLHWALGWAQLIDGERQRPLDVDAMIEHRQAPLEEMPERLGFPARPWLDWIDASADATYWPEVDLLETLAANPLPTLHVGGWHDFSLASTFDLYRRQAAAPDQQLVIGPWEHNAVFDALLEGLLNPAAQAESQSTPGRLARTFVSFLEARRLGESGSSPAVQVWRGGDDVWSELDSWPPAERRDMQLQRLSSRIESVELPMDEHEGSFVPPVGGRLWSAPGWSTGGSTDVEANRHAARFELANASTGLELAGPAKLHLAFSQLSPQSGDPQDPRSETPLASGVGEGLAPSRADVSALRATGEQRGNPSTLARSSASPRRAGASPAPTPERTSRSDAFSAHPVAPPAVDLYARLLDLDSDGDAVWVGEGVQRCESGAELAELDFGELHHYLAPGHRLVLELQPGRFPVYDRAAGRLPSRAAGARHSLLIGHPATYLEWTVPKPRKAPLRDKPAPALTAQHSATR